jgi:uncharacterized protein (TIGR02466 family)
MSIGIDNIQIFPVLIHETKLFEESPEKIKKILDYCKNLEFIEDEDIGTVDQTKNSYLHLKEDCPELSELTEIIESILDAIRISEVYDAERFEISQMWVNKSKKFVYHNTHWHSNSFYSGVFYLTGGSPIVFYDPVYGRQMSSLNVWAESTQPAIKRDISPGKLIIFPSYLQHKTLPHTNEDARYSISFNSVPSGKINHRSPYTSLSQLNIEIK